MVASTAAFRCSPACCWSEAGKALPLKICCYGGKHCSFQVQSCMLLVGLKSSFPGYRRRTQSAPFGHKVSPCPYGQAAYCTARTSAGWLCRDPLADVTALQESRASILVGTPGRLFDVLQRCAFLDLKHLEVLILDEADRLLDMGFRGHIDAIMARLPKQRRTGKCMMTGTCIMFGTNLQGLQLLPTSFAWQRAQHSMYTDAYAHTFIFLQKQRPSCKAVPLHRLPAGLSDIFFYYLSSVFSHITLHAIDRFEAHKVCRLVFSHTDRRS